MIASWRNIDSIAPTAFICGYCGLNVAGDKGYVKQTHGHWIYPCPACERPTYFEGDKQMPGVAFGGEVDKLPLPVASLVFD